MCKVRFSRGKYYQDEVQFDVVEMDACQVLLGRPWQYNVEALHKGKQNFYIFVWKGKKIALIPNTDIYQCKEKKIRETESTT